MAAHNQMSVGKMNESFAPATHTNPNIGCAFGGPKKEKSKILFSVQLTFLVLTFQLHRCILGLTSPKILPSPIVPFRHR